MSSLVTCARLGERRVDRGLVAERPRVALVARRAVVNRGAPVFSASTGVDDRRQHFVVDVDQFGGVLGLVGRFGDDQRDAVADVADLALRQYRMRRLLHRLAVGAGDQPSARQSVDAGQVVAGEDRDDAGRGLRLGGVDAADLRMRVRRAQEIGVRVMLRVDVVGVLAGAGEKTIVFLAADRLADAVQIAGTHRSISSSPARPASPP